MTNVYLYCVILHVNVSAVPLYFPLQVAYKGIDVSTDLHANFVPFKNIYM